MHIVFLLVYIFNLTYFTGMFHHVFVPTVKSTSKLTECQSSQYFFSLIKIVSYFAENLDSIFWSVDFLSCNDYKHVNVKFSLLRIKVCFEKQNTFATPCIQGTQLSMQSPGFVIEPYAPREPIAFWRRLVIVYFLQFIISFKTSNLYNHLGANVVA